MHSRIFQLGLEENTDNLINEVMFDDECELSWFTNSIADYVSESDINEDIEWFLSCIPENTFEYNKDEHSIIFKENFAKEYFSVRYKRFSILKDKVTEEVFNGNDVESSNILYALRTILGDEYSFYIYYDEYEELKTIDEFIRENLTVNVKYYFGNTIDYHC